MTLHDIIGQTYHRLDYNHFNLTVFDQAKDDVFEGNLGEYFAGNFTIDKGSPVQAYGFSNKTNTLTVFVN